MAERTTIAIDVDRTENGWKATEHGSDLSALGDTPQLAVMNYGRVCEDVVNGGGDAGEVAEEPEHQPASGD